VKRNKKRTPEMVIALETKKNVDGNLFEWESMSAKGLVIPMGTMIAKNHRVAIATRYAMGFKRHKPMPSGSQNSKPNNGNAHEPFAMSLTEAAVMVKHERAMMIIVARRIGDLVLGRRFTRRLTKEA
jgi:hypothetical protein